MQVLGIGTDIVEVPRIAHMIQKHQEMFLQRVFTAHEIQYCAARRAANQHFAGRWAAKEAILKAIGTGWAKGIAWTDLEVRNASGGMPQVHLAGRARDICRQRGIDDVLVSISHCRTFAVAYAMAVAHSTR